MAAAVRNARTMTTGAECAGRVDSYKRAESMGVHLQQEWMATLDGRTRHTHRQLHGECIDVGSTFSNGCRFPGDPSGPAEEIYNCRCTLVSAIKGFEGDKVTSSPKMGDMSFEEWVGEHEEKEVKSEIVNNQTIDKEPQSGIMNIVGLTKINEKHKVVNPLNASQYYRMKANLERKGCSVISAKGDDERYLIAFNSEAITDEKGIMHLGNILSASAFFEETIHYTQIQKYGVLDSTDFIERDAREVAANRKLLKNGKQYGFTQEDYDDVKNNLDFWEKDLKERVGVSYDESDLNREV